MISFDMTRGHWPQSSLKEDEGFQGCLLSHESLSGRGLWTKAGAFWSSLSIWWQFHQIFCPSFSFVPPPSTSFVSHFSFPLSISVFCVIGLLCSLFWHRFVFTNVLASSSVMSKTYYPSILHNQESQKWCGNLSSCWLTINNNLPRMVLLG